MDYQGQKLAELIFHWIILSCGAIGWIIGYFQQDFTVVFQAWLVGVVISVIVSFWHLSVDENDVLKGKEYDMLLRSG